MKADKATSQLMVEASDIQEMLGMRGWVLFRKLLDAKIMELQMIANVTGETPEAKVISMEVNQQVASSLFNIIQEITGTVQQVKTNTEYLNIDNKSIYKEL